MPDGRTWRFTSTGVLRPGSSQWDDVITYDTENRVRTFTRAGTTWTYGYQDANGLRTTTVSGPLGAGRVVTADLNRSLVLTDRDALGRTTAYRYDARDRVDRMTRPEGNYVEVEYDPRGNVVRQTHVAKGGTSSLTQRAGYSTDCPNAVICNKPLWTRDAAGHQTDYVWDATHGGLLSATAPAGANGVRPQQRTAYAWFLPWTGQQAGYQAGAVALPVRSGACRTAQSCEGGADETATSIVYQGLGPHRLAMQSVTTGAGDGSLSATSSVGYDQYGNVTAADGPLPGAADTTRVWHDLARRVTHVIGPDPDGGGPLRHRAQRVIFADDGSPLEQQTGAASGYDPNAFQQLIWTRARFDSWGRPVGVEQRTGAGVKQLVERSYDALGRPECAAVRMNRGSFGGSTYACQLTGEGADGPDRITYTQYNAAGQVTGVKSGYGTAAEGWDWLASYTPNGHREYLTDGENNVTKYVYDEFDRFGAILYPSRMWGAGSSDASNYEGYGYDARGLVTAVRQRDGSRINFRHDALGNVISKDLPNQALHENDISYRYDNAGRLLEAWDTGTHFTRLGYDALGRVTSESSNWITRTHGYDLAGRRTRLAYNDGLFIAYERLVTGETRSVRENGGFELAAYGYDDLGRRAWLQRGNGARTSWGYDGWGDMTSLVQDLAGTAHDQSYGYAYDAAGGLTGRTATNDAYAWRGQAMGDAWESVNGLNQITQSGAESLAYDGRGNLNQAGSRTYGYTGENKLSSADGNRMAFDPMGRMHWINGHTTLQYDGQALIAELDGDRPYRRRYVHGDGSDEPLVWYEGAGTGDRRWLHTDERGSVVAVSNGGGSAFAINRYDEYGMPDPGNTGRFGYTGQTWVAEAGAWHYKARAYAPGLGRFMQTDPIGYGDGMNLYGYVGGDPVNNVDPTGTEFNRHLVRIDGPAMPNEVVVTATRLTCNACNFGFTLQIAGNQFLSPAIGALNLTATEVDAATEGGEEVIVEGNRPGGPCI